jgi:hypothetical protein
MYSKLSRKQWKKYSATSQEGYPLADKHSQLNFLHNYQNLSEKTFSKEDTAPFIENGVEIHVKKPLCSQCFSESAVSSECRAKEEIPKWTAHRGKLWRKQLYLLS